MHPTRHLWPSKRFDGHSFLQRYTPRGKRGVNGDVVHHLHGRNLEAEIWNDQIRAAPVRTGAEPRVIFGICQLASGIWQLATGPTLRVER